MNKTKFNHLLSKLVQTQGQIALKLGYSADHIGRVASGRLPVSEKLANRICELTRG